MVDVARRWFTLFIHNIGSKGIFVSRIILAQSVKVAWSVSLAFWQEGTPPLCCMLYGWPSTR